MPKSIVDAAVREGKFYAVPVNIHGQNWMFYNTKIFADAGVEPPKTFPELIEAGEKLKAKGIIPDRLRRPAELGAQLCSAPSSSGTAAPTCSARYMAVATRTPRRARLQETAEVFAKLRGLVDPGSPGRNWNDATSLVITNKAAMQFMGDWAKGEFIAAGQTAGQGIRLHDRRARAAASS